MTWRRLFAEALAKEDQATAFAKAPAVKSPERILMHYVYLIRSVHNPEQTYIGLTEDLKTRLAKHNEGGAPHTSKYKPWALQTYLAFSSRGQAAEFETYLKSGSGRAFALKRLW